MLGSLRGCSTPGRQVFVVCLHFKAGIISCTGGHHGRQMASNSFDTLTLHVVYLLMSTWLTKE